ncbi:MAG: DUF4192 family protein [Gulosibacter sp.]|uniref:DUF4192 family protein n=1 Tax=Gulosibacter sp. TaxID=2817531 RepID=UPI003F8FAA73
MKQPKKLRTALDILATAPEMVGYFPNNSLVLIPLTYGHGRACIRVDLPANEGVSPTEYAVKVVEQLQQLRDTSSVIICLFSENPIIDDRAPFSLHMATLMAYIDFYGVRVKWALCCAGNGWMSYNGEERGTLRDLDRAIPNTVASSFEEFAQIPVVDAAARRALRKAMREGAGIKALDGPEVLMAWETLLDGSTSSSEELLVRARASVAVGLRDPLMTGCILANAVYGSEASLDLERVWSALLNDGDQYIDSIISERIETEPIDLERTANGAVILRTIIGTLSPGTDRSTALAALSWLEWARGSSSLASYYAHEALDGSEDIPLARIVYAMSENSITPGWIREVGATGGFTEDDFDLLLEATE